MASELYPREDFGYRMVPVTVDSWVAPSAKDLLVDPTLVPMSYVDESDFCGPPTSNHGRNQMITALGGYLRESTVLTDENGDGYPIYTLKGNLVNDVFATSYHIEPSCVRVNGMEDAAIHPRTRKVSEVLRREGLLTEYIVAQVRPKQFPVQDVNGTVTEVGLLAYKEHIYNQTLANHKDSVSPARAGHIAQILLDMQFGVTTRAFLSAYRVDDLKLLKPESRANVVSLAIQMLKKRKPEHFSAYAQLEELDPDNPNDQIIYLTEVLPNIIGENLARLHNLGLWHHYPHPGNWSLAGELVDGDSVTGKQLDDYDDETTIAMRAHELVGVIDRTSRFLSFDASDINKIDRRMMDGYYAERVLDATPQEQVILEALLFSINGGDTLTVPDVTSFVSCIDQGSEAYTRLLSLAKNYLSCMDPLYNHNYDLSDMHADIATRLGEIVAPIIAWFLHDVGISTKTLPNIDLFIECYEVNRILYYAALQLGINLKRC
jgi:hypothetical protein